MVLPETRQPAFVLSAQYLIRIALAACLKTGHDMTTSSRDVPSDCT
jgi:hypothetical protein